MTGGKPQLAFVSPVFLFPNDTGGRIRTTNILRGLHGGVFDVTLIGPASPAQQADWASRLREVCDRFVAWPPAPARPRWMRAAALLHELPVNVAADSTAPAAATVQRTLATAAFDVVVFDFVHAAVLRPQGLRAPTVCFTHNVEAEIFARHAQQAANPIMRRIWSSQQRKMQRFEREALRGFDSVVAVSERDARQLFECYAIATPATIPTGVDLEYFAWQEPPPVEPGRPPTVVFTGSMDWNANVDGVRHFLTEAWPLVHREVPATRFVVVGRRPPAALVELARTVPGVSFTGFVDDIRPYVHSAHAFVIPLRVGGGTRIKAFEAMAMGCPVVSTAVGVEGLDVQPQVHYLLHDEPAEFARAVVALLRDPLLRRRVSADARRCVQERFGYQVAARAFERVCVQVWRNHQVPHAATAIA